MEIKEVIQRMTEVTEERKNLNTLLREHFTPLLQEAGQAQDVKQFDRLMAEIPDCPFYMTALRMHELYFGDLN